MIISVLATLIKSTIFPLIYIAAVLTSESIVAGRQYFPPGQFNSGGFRCSLGYYYQHFIGVLVVQGGGFVSDGVSIRTVKFWRNLGTTSRKNACRYHRCHCGLFLLLKNAIGIVGVIAVILLCAFPS